MSSAGEPRSSGDRTGGIAAVVIAALVIFLYLVRGILLPFVLAGIVAFVCAPLVDGLARRTGLPRWAPALAVLAALMGLTALGLYIGLPSLLHEWARIASDLQGSLEGFMRALIGNRTLDFMGSRINASTLASNLIDGLTRWLGSDSHIAEVASYAVATVFGGILVWVLFGYFLIDAQRIGAGLLWLAPPRHRPLVQRAWRELEPLLRRYFIGVALVVVYASIAAYIGIGIALGLTHAVFLAILTGALEAIPVIGPAAAAVLVGLVAVQHAATAADIVAFVAYAIALRISIDQFFGPLVLGSAARVRPIVIIFCFLAGGAIFGIVGVILAVPVALSLKVILAILYREPHTESR